MITDEQLDAIDQASYDEIDEFDWAYVEPEIVRALTAEVRDARNHAPLGREHCEPLHEELKRRFDRIEVLEAEVRRGRKIEEAAQQAKALSRPNSLIEEGFYAIALGELWIALNEAHRD
jgi:hypothetical protein